MPYFGDLDDVGEALGALSDADIIASHDWKRTKLLQVCLFCFCCPVRRLGWVMFCVFHFALLSLLFTFCPCFSLCPLSPDQPLRLMMPK